MEFGLHGDSKERRLSVMGLISPLVALRNKDVEQRVTFAYATDCCNN